MTATDEPLNRRGFIRNVVAAGAVATGAPSVVSRPLASGTWGAQASLDGLDRYVEQALLDWSIPGAAIAVVRDTQVLYAKGHGVKQIGGTDKVDEIPCFRLAQPPKHSPRRPSAYSSTRGGSTGMTRWPRICRTSNCTIPGARGTSPFETR